MVKGRKTNRVHARDLKYVQAGIIALFFFSVINALSDRCRLFVSVLSLNCLNEEGEKENGSPRQDQQGWSGTG